MDLHQPAQLVRISLNHPFPHSRTCRADARQRCYTPRGATQPYEDIVRTSCAPRNAQPRDLRTSYASSSVSQLARFGSPEVRVLTRARRACAPPATRSASYKRSPSRPRVRKSETAPRARVEVSESLNHLLLTKHECEEFKSRESTLHLES